MLATKLAPFTPLAETEWDADDVRVYTDTRVIMGLLKMMHRRNIFRLCGEYLFPGAYAESRVYDNDRIYRETNLMYLNC